MLDTSRRKFMAKRDDHWIPWSETRVTKGVWFIDHDGKFIRDHLIKPTM
jgi:hypothetical protein